ncbi:unnamed protein product [Leuciscus chuanchicus]
MCLRTTPNLDIHNGIITSSCSKCRASCAPTSKHGCDKKVSGLNYLCEDQRQFQASRRVGDSC